MHPVYDLELVLRRIVCLSYSQCPRYVSRHNSLQNKEPERQGACAICNAALYLPTLTFSRRLDVFPCWEISNVHLIAARDELHLAFDLLKAH